ncbi:hypothetical protein LINGRAHAP2_LOCUS20791 [Linum grandiflorum]
MTQLSAISTKLKEISTFQPLSRHPEVEQCWKLSSKPQLKVEKQETCLRRKTEEEEDLPRGAAEGRSGRECGFQ